jgi:hypothetical protein
MIKVGRLPVDTTIMSNDEHSTSSTTPAVNQFGTPVGQFGTAPDMFGTRNQFGSPTQLGAPHGYGWAPPAAPAPPRRRAGGVLLRTVAALAVVAAAGFLLRYVVFPDLSKPIALPATVAGVGSMGAGQGQPVTLQSKDPEGHAVAIGVYADDPTAPRAMAIVTAGRVKDMNTDRITSPSTTIGEVSCTAEVDSAQLRAFAGAPQGASTAAMRALTTGAACWRTGRHLTVVVVALSADGTAQAVATRAVSEAWHAI